MGRERVELRPVRVRHLDQAHVAGWRAGPREPCRPFGGRDGVPVVVDPRPTHERPTNGPPLVDEAEALQQASRGEIERVERRGHACRATLEQRVHQRTDRLGAKALAPAVGSQRIAHRGGGARPVEPDREVADELAVLLDAELHPTPRLGSRDAPLVGGEALR